MLRRKNTRTRTALPNAAEAKLSNCARARPLERTAAYAACAEPTAANKQAQRVLHCDCLPYVIARENHLDLGKKNKTTERLLPEPGSGM